MAYTLYCTIRNAAASSAFGVEVGDDSFTVDKLKSTIKDQQLAHSKLKDIPADEMVVWKLSSPIIVGESLKLVNAIARLRCNLPEAVELSEPRRTVTSYFPEGVKAADLHIVVDLPLEFSQPVPDLLPLFSHFWGEKRIETRNIAGKDCQVIDLKLFTPLINPRRDHILLVRDEYVKAYDIILEATEHASKQSLRSAFLITGQPGIGKTLFLFYVLVRRLEERNPVAFQHGSSRFTLFNKDSVTHHRCEDIETGSILQDTWGLSDMSGSSAEGPCDVFKQSYAHLIHSSSPASRHWKDWKKQASATLYIMDVWSQDELRGLLMLYGLDVQQGVELFQKFGPSPRIIIEILRTPSAESEYIRKIKSGASLLAKDFATIVPGLNTLDFSSDFSSAIITVRPKLPDNSHHYVLDIPTPFLLNAFSMALSHREAAEQHHFFRILNAYPSLQSARSLMFENYAHVILSKSKRKPIEVHCHDNSTNFIPAPAEIISGSTAMAQVTAPLDFYWQPRDIISGVHAVLCTDDIVWVIQFTTSFSLSAIESGDCGVEEVHKQLNHKTGIKWHLVFVGPELSSAKKMRDTVWGKWKSKEESKLLGREFYACQLQFGDFDIVDQSLGMA